MNQNGYLLITIFSSTALILIIALTILDAVKTQRQRMYAQLLLERARDVFTKIWESEPSSVDEMHVLHDVVLVTEPVGKYRKADLSGGSPKGPILGTSIQIQISLRGLHLKISRTRGTPTGESLPSKEADPHTSSKEADL